MATSYEVDGYPYGKLRTKIRYGLEFKPSKGLQFISQTLDPNRLIWNKPKASTYALLAGNMYLDERNHVQWKALTEYSSAEEILEFIKMFPHSEFLVLKAFAYQKAKFLRKAAEGEPIWIINGVPQPQSERELRENRKDLDLYEQILKKI